MPMNHRAVVVAVIDIEYDNAAYHVIDVTCRTNAAEVAP